MCELGFFGGIDGNIDPVVSKGHLGSGDQLFVIEIAQRPCPLRSCFPAQAALVQRQRTLDGGPVLHLSQLVGAGLVNRSRRHHDVAQFFERKQAIVMMLTRKRYKNGVGRPDLFLRFQCAGFPVTPARNLLLTSRHRLDCRQHLRPVLHP